MKSKLLIALVALLALPLMGCEEDNVLTPVDAPPAAPQGVFTITGNLAVYVWWNGPYESDIVSYQVWRSLDALTGYTMVGERAADPNPNLDLIFYEYVDNNNLVNGQRYYYAVASVDAAGNVSELSAENAHDTPRPEGQVVIFDVAIEAALAGYDFSSQTVVPWNSVAADIYIDGDATSFYINVANTDVDIQDVGYYSNFDGLDVAPTSGWSENGWAELIDGHIYVIWTADLHYAKLWVESINSGSVTFRWAYQTKIDDPELIARGEASLKPEHSPGYLKINATPTTAGE